MCMRRESQDVAQKAQFPGAEFFQSLITFEEPPSGTYVKKDCVTGLMKGTVPGKLSCSSEKGFIPLNINGFIFLLRRFQGPAIGL
jgi:hypothetical protein